MVRMISEAILYIFLQWTKGQEARDDTSQPQSLVERNESLPPARPAPQFMRTRNCPRLFLLSVLCSFYVLTQIFFILQMRKLRAV